MYGIRLHAEFTSMPWREFVDLVQGVMGRPGTQLARFFAP